MFEVELSFKMSSECSVLAQLRHLSETFRPRLISDDEDGPRRRLNFDRTTALEELRGFLWSDECQFQLNAKNAETFTLLAFTESARTAQTLVQQFVTLDIIFGYACLSRERDHRNRIARDMPYGYHEAWVGRNYEKYLPGVYWFTAFSVFLQNTWGINLDSLRNIVESVTILSNSAIFVQAYESPDQWVQNACKIDEWCFSTPGCFSKERVEEQMLAARTFTELSDVISSYP
jgi:hypothetical protein